MVNRRTRPILIALIAMVCVWLLAWGGYSIAKNSKVTAEKVADYLHGVDLSQLSGEARAKALRDLATKLNALKGEERRRARLDAAWERWFAEMSEEEKAAFLEATLPSGFKQMLTSFEQLPEEKRKRAIDDALRELRKARQEIATAPGQAQRRAGANRPTEFSPELQQKAVKLGLKSFYTESSAQTKAELAPLLEEMQRLMESGGRFRGR